MLRVVKTGRRRKMALLTTWRLNSLMMKAFTVSSQISGPWAVSFMRWRQVCRPSKQVASSSLSLRSRAGRTSQLPMLQPFSLIFWAVYSKKILWSVFLGSIWESIHFGQKRSTVESYQGSPHLMTTWGSSETSILTNSLSSRLLKATSSQILRILSCRVVLMLSDCRSVLRKTWWKRQEITR